MTIDTRRLTWLWLLVEFLHLPFAAYQSAIPLAAWLAPIFLLHFARTAPRVGTALLSLFAAEAHYRGVENGFALVRPAANGPSLIADPEGRALASRDYFADGAGIMLARLPTRGVATVYSRMGDGFAYLCVGGLMGLMGLALLGREQKRYRPAPAESGAASGVRR